MGRAGQPILLSVPDLKSTIFFARAGVFRSFTTRHSLIIPILYVVPPLSREDDQERRKMHRVVISSLLLAAGKTFKEYRYKRPAKKIIKLAANLLLVCGHVKFGYKGSNFDK